MPASGLFLGSNLYQRNFWLWGLGTILLSILMTWIFNNTKGSVLAASLLHGMANTGIFWFQLDWRYYMIELLTVIVILIIFGAKNLVRQKHEPVWKDGYSPDVVGRERNAEF